MSKFDKKIKPDKALRSFYAEEVPNFRLLAFDVFYDELKQLTYTELKLGEGHEPKSKKICRITGNLLIPPCMKSPI